MVAEAKARGRPRAKPAAPAETRERGGIQSLERAAALLEAVARRPEGSGLAELSTAVGLHTSTAFHLIRTLVQLGFLTQDAESKRYRIGSRIFTLAAGALEENALLSLATPVLERLSADTGEAAHLAVRSKQEIVVIARTAASGLLQLAGRTGATRPAHATAIGKMLLAAMAPDDLDRLLEGLPLPAYTAKTITSARALRRELAAVRRQGIAYDDCELDDDVRCIALPVRDFAGRCVGAIGISGPVWRMSRQAMAEKSQRLRTAAAELSALLGCAGFGDAV
ncbi:MAG TPA: IclR family transcriptional regulator [Kiloniellaceae bacterium]